MNAVDVKNTENVGVPPALIWVVTVGPTADVRLPPGATRVDLAGKTVMPMLIDTHVHLSPTREAIMRDQHLTLMHAIPPIRVSWPVAYLEASYADSQEASAHEVIEQAQGNGCPRTWTPPGSTSGSPAKGG